MVRFPYDSKTFIMCQKNPCIIGYWGQYNSNTRKKRLVSLLSNICSLSSYSGTINVEIVALNQNVYSQWDIIQHYKDVYIYKTESYVL